MGQRIVSAMRRAGLRKADLAEMVGVSWTAVNAWAKDRSIPAAKNLRRIAEATGVTMEWLETGQASGEEPRDPRVQEAVDAFLRSPDGPQVTKAEEDELRQLRFGPVTPTWGMIRAIWMEMRRKG